MEIITQSGMAINELRSQINTKHEDEDKNSIKNNETSSVQNETTASSGKNIYQENEETGTSLGVQGTVMEARTDRVETSLRSEMNTDKADKTETTVDQNSEKLSEKPKNEYQRNVESTQSMASLNERLYAQNAKKAYEEQKTVTPWRYTTLFHH